MAIIREKYKFCIKTRRMTPTPTYAETEFKQARLFITGADVPAKIYAQLTARMKGEETFGYINYRYGDVAASADCLTLYTPLNKLLIGEWLQTQITGEAAEHIKYNGTEIQGIKRRDNSTMILSSKPVPTTEGAW